MVDSEPGSIRIQHLSAIFDLYGKLKGKRLVGDKTPGYVCHIPMLHHLWPSANSSISLGTDEMFSLPPPPPLLPSSSSLPSLPLSDKLE